MKKSLKVILFVFMACLLVSLGACDKKKKGIDLSGVIFESQTFTYDGSPKSLSCSNVPEGITVKYEGNGKQAIGIYEVKANLFASNDELLKSLTATLTIKANIDISGVSFKDQTFTYDGNEHEIVCSNVPEGIIVTYLANKRTEVGSNVAVAILTYNTVKLAEFKAVITISNGQNPTPDPTPEPTPTPTPTPTPEPTPTPDPTPDPSITVPTEGKYYLVINGTTYVALNDAEPFNDFEQFNTLKLSLASGDVISFFNAEAQEGWTTITIDPYSAGSFTQGENGIVCGEDGTYDFYLKLKYQADQIYIGISQ